MTTKTERDRQKLIQDKCQEFLSKMLRDEDNKYCVDCDAKGPRWASWNLGIFLCIRCAGIHRNLGVHISKVKSVNLDSWTAEQVTCLQQMGNSRARAVYEANVPDNFRRPQTDSSLEAFIRAKYEHKKYIAREWVPPPIPKVNWDLELEEGKKKKEVKKSTPTINTVELPPPNPIPKPKPSGGSAGSTPKSSRATIDLKTKQPAKKSATEDLLGLDAPPEQQTNNDDIFTGFLSAPPAPTVEIKPKEPTLPVDPDSANSKRSAEEESFFNQATTPAQDKKTPLSKDSILALYSQSTPANANTFTGVPGAVFPPQPFPQAVFAPPLSFGNLSNGVLPAQQMVPGAPVIPQPGMFGALPVDVHPQLNVASNPFFNMGAPVQSAPPMFQSLPTVGLGQEHAASKPVSSQELLNFDSTPSQVQMSSTRQENTSQILSQQMTGLSLAATPGLVGQVPPVAMGIAPGSLGYTHPTGQTLSTNLWQ